MSHGSSIQDDARVVLFNNGAYYKSKTYQFLKKNGFIFNGRRTVGCTMNSQIPGGNFKFPHHNWAAVQKCIMADVKSGVKFSFNELALGYVRPFFELDFKDTDYSLDTMMKYVRAIHSVVTRCFTSEADCVLSTCEPKWKGDKLACGLHMVYTKKCVTLEDLRDLIYAVREVGLIPNGLDVDMVDDGVVHDSYASLRVPGAIKDVKCFICGNMDELKRDCHTCIAMGKMVYDVPYYTIGTLKHSGEYIPTDDKHLYTFIVPKVQHVSEDYAFAAGLPRHIPAKKRRRSNGVRDPHVSTSDPKVGRNMVLEENAEIRRILLELVKGLSPHYQKSTLHNVMRGATALCFYMKGEGRHYCLVNREEHSSNCAAFTVSKKGSIRVRCGNPRCSAILKDPEKKLDYEFPVALSYTTALFPSEHKPVGSHKYLSFSAKRRKVESIPKTMNGKQLTEDQRAQLADLEEFLNKMK